MGSRCHNHSGARIKHSVTASNIALYLHFTVPCGWSLFHHLRTVSLLSSNIIVCTSFSSFISGARAVQTLMLIHYAESL